MEKRKIGRPRDPRIREKIIDIMRLKPKFLYTVSYLARKIGTSQISVGNVMKDLLGEKKIDAMISDRFTFYVWDGNETEKEASQ